MSPFLSALHPERYHGHGKRPPFFEGWYFKVVDAREEARYAIIPGVFLSSSSEQQHAFVQVLDGQRAHATYHPFPLEEFWAAEDRFEIRIGPNRFTTDEIALQIEAPDRTVVGDLSFHGLTPWPVTWRSPGIMGWYAWVPFMECYHGVLSLDHGIEGTLAIDGRPVDFGGGRGYIEKDWGRSFPSAWIWFQSNHFDRPETCITASVAEIPWVGRSFAGFIVGLLHQGTLYRFATYSGAKIEDLRILEDRVSWVLGDREHRLELQATRPAGAPLLGPTVVGMDRRVPETLRSVVEVRLSAREGRTIFHGAGRHAGLEAVGDLAHLVSMAGIEPRDG